MNLKSAFALLAAGTFLVACGADEVVNINDEAKDKATITLKVMDNHDGSAIEEVTVYSVVDDKEKKSDKLGLSVWKDQELGTHAFQVSKDGYATILLSVVLAEQGQGNVARVGDVIEPVYMYKTGVTAKGTVLFTDEKGNKKAVEGAVVYATLPNIFVPSELSAKTDKNGEYKFENLPEGVAVDISVGQTTIDKKTYAGQNVETIGGPSYRAGDAVAIDIIDMDQVSSQLVPVSNNLDAIDTTTSLKLTFSTELNADSVDGKWFVSKAGDDVLVTVSRGDDKKSIVIKPFSGKWTKGSSYTVDGVVYSTDGAKKSFSASFTVSSKSASGAPDNAKDLKAAQSKTDEDEVVLTWTAPKTAFSRYVLYYKTDKMADYVEFNTYSNLADEITLDVGTSYYADIDTDGIKSITFILRTISSAGVLSDASKAPKVEYKIPEKKTTTTIDPEDP
jgi:hypothetical protein